MTTFEGWVRVCKETGTLIERIEVGDGTDGVYATWKYHEGVQETFYHGWPHDTCFHVWTGDDWTVHATVEQACKLWEIRRNAITINGE